VFRGQARVLVEKSSIPIAAIISAADFERLIRLEAECEALGFSVPLLRNIVHRSHEGAGGLPLPTSGNRACWR
jgi:hypothetical protein